jgi:hypothetical protein
MMQTGPALAGIWSIGAMDFIWSSLKGASLAPKAQKPFFISSMGDRSHEPDAPFRSRLPNVP